jgi:hypothetical protein
MSRRLGRNARARIATVATQAVDTGASGPAALARRMVEMPTDTAGVTCRQVIEQGPLHGLRLDQRQADAAAQLAQLWRDALPGRVRAGGYGAGGHHSRALTAEEEAEAGQAAREYRAALDACQWATGVRGVIAVEQAVVYHERGHYAAHLLPALSALADHFGLL